VCLCTYMLEFFHSNSFRSARKRFGQWAMASSE
jgi:hypothetical protein